MRRGDVLVVWFGLRLLVKDFKVKNMELLVRNYFIDISESGFVICVGGKWMIY